MGLTEKIALKSTLGVLTASWICSLTLIDLFNKLMLF